MNTTLFVKDFRGNDPRFVYYLFEQMDLSGYNSGSVQPMLNRNYIAAVPVLLPPVDVQRAISQVLGDLDDKIAFNRKIWRQRIAIAQALYRQRIAEARRAVPLGDLYQVGLSGVWGEDASSSLHPIATNCLRGRDIEDLFQGASQTAPVRYISERQAGPRRFRDGELWTAGSGSLGPTMLVNTAAGRRWPLPLTYSNFVKRLVPIGQSRMAATAWHAVVAAWQRGEFDAYTSGTAMPNLSTDALLGGLRVPMLGLPAQEEIAAITNLALEPGILIQNEKLAALRDALAPELLSGRLSSVRAESHHRAFG